MIKTREIIFRQDLTNSVQNASKSNIVTVFPPEATILDVLYHQVHAYGDDTGDITLTGKDVVLGTSGNYDVPFDMKDSGNNNKIFSLRDINDGILIQPQIISSGPYDKKKIIFFQYISTSGDGGPGETRIIIIYNEPNEEVNVALVS